MASLLKKIVRKDLLPQLLDRYHPRLYQLKKRMFGEKDSALCLCFHDVSDDEGLYPISTEDFKDIVLGIRDRVVSIDNILNGGIVITFDDGFDSLYSTVLPFMEEQKIPFTCYITTGYLNTPKYLSTDHLQKLASSKYCTIGSHMVTHRKTRKMTRDEVVNEWRESKQTLESLIGKEVVHAALPYGSYVNCTIKSKRMALKNGYETIADTIAIPFHTNSRVIHRYVYSKESNRVINAIKQNENNNK